MIIRVGCEFIYTADSPVPMLTLVRARPNSGDQVVHESHWLEPILPLHEYADQFGNRCWRLVAPAGQLILRYDAAMEIAGHPDPVLPEAPLVPVQDLPDDTLVFTLPSRYVESDLLLDDAWQLFSQTPPTWARVQAVTDWVHQNIRYEMGSSRPNMTALHVFQNRVGVCRDFALISVALCRALNIPARYTFGYLPDIAVEPPDTPMDFHAWFEAFIDGQWHTFDARHNQPRIGRVVIGRGRDAVDVALSTTYGPIRLDRMTVWADEVTADNPGGPPREEDADALEAADRRDPSISRWGGNQPTGSSEGA